MALRKALPFVQVGDIESNDNGNRWLELVTQRVIDIRGINFTWNPALLAANTHVEESVTVSGIKPEDIILAIIKPTFTQGFHVGQGRVSADNTLSIQVVNGTGSASNPAEETYELVYVKNSSI